MSDSLLPPNASDFELELEQALRTKTQAIDPDIVRKLHDPMQCPVEFLPWLAFAESVDSWNDAWPEMVKRSVIANAQVSHRHKGTIGGLTDALAALGVDIEIVEWWQEQPLAAVGTMRLILWISQDSPATDSHFVGYMLRTIDQNKRAVIHYQFSLGADFRPAQFAIGLSTQFYSNIHINASAKAQVNSQFGMGLGFSTQFFCSQTIELVI